MLLFIHWSVFLPLFVVILCLYLVCCVVLSESRHEISNNVVCATSKGSDQPAHVRSLIRAFATHLNTL